MDNPQSQSVRASAKDLPNNMSVAIASSPTYITKACKVAAAVPPKGGPLLAVEIGVSSGATSGVCCP
jgi:hypothetical protein